MCFFLCACGLAVYYVLEAPDCNDEKYAGVTNYEDKYFDFDTADSDNYGTSGYKGTKVYYKIYNSLTKLTTHVSNIESVNDEYSEDGYDKMTGYGYQALQFDDSGYANDVTSSSYIKSNLGSDQVVAIRLITEGYTGSEYYTGLYLDADEDAQLTSGSEDALILRNSGDAFSLSDVTDDIETAVDEGNTGDQDDMWIYETSDDDWYVAAYAVAYGYDSSYSPFYSEVTYLGYLTFEYSD
jgi:hypothetical protein